MNVDIAIIKTLDIENITSMDLYRDSNFRNDCSKKVADIVNEFVDKVPNCHNPSDEETLKKYGCVTLENFMSEEDVDSVLKLIENEPGYNYHIAANAYNQNPEIFRKDLEWNILSYKPDILLSSETILRNFTDKKLISLVQSYLGCLPTIFSLNCVWSKFTGEEFKTQKIHRDYDDFRFLTLFVILTDINEKNGPHVFYPNTQDGSEIVSEPFIIQGKKGTAFLADTYAYHNGMPLEEGQRCLLWVRFGLYKNNAYRHGQYNLFVQESKNIFNLIPENETNKYLLRGFISE